MSERKTTKKEKKKRIFESYAPTHLPVVPSPCTAEKTKKKKNKKKLATKKKQKNVCILFQ